MPFIQRERFNHPHLSQFTIERGTKQFAIRYNQEQLGKSNTYFQTLFQRQDVASIFTDSSPTRVTLHKKAIESSDGVHNYLIINQGKRRFLFDLPEDPKLPQSPSEMTWVVPTRELEQTGYLPDVTTSNFRPFTKSGEYRRFLHKAEHLGYFAGRFSGADVEHNPDFLQPIPCVIVSDTKRLRRGQTQDPKILFSLRNANNSLSDGRLAGMMVVPFAMGHSNPEDANRLRPLLKQANYREIAEETALTTRRPNSTETFHPLFNRKGEITINPLTIWRLRRYYRLQPLGILRADQLEVDRVHAGIIILAEPKTSHTVFSLNGTSHENTSALWRSLSEFQNDVSTKRFAQASWNQPTIDQAITPYYRNTRRKKS